MIKIGSYNAINDEDYDEIWFIMRSVKAIPSLKHTVVRHVPELSPSKELFFKYLNLKEESKWNESTFENMYVPRFLLEMHSRTATNKLNELYEAGQNKCILLVCACKIESLCHRSIVLGLMQGKNAKDIHTDITKHMRLCGEDLMNDDYSCYYPQYVDMRGSLPNVTQVKASDKTMCFTGRRPKDLHGYNHDAYYPIINATKTALRDIITNHGYTKFISGGAQGFDQLAFWSVNGLKKEGLNIKNIVYVPFRGQESKWSQAGLFSQQEYGLMLRLADEIVYVNSTINNSDKKKIVSSLYDRNHAMVEASEAVFGLYPDYGWMMPSTKGGTAECLKYAKLKDKRIFQLSNETLLSQWITE